MRAVSGCNPDGNENLIVTKLSYTSLLIGLE